MEIILIQDVDKLGNKDDIINVKPGYARNYLIPKKFAIMATETAKKIHAENLKQRAHKEAKLINDANNLAQKMENIFIKIPAKTSTTGKIFGSVNTIMISEALTKEGFNIDRKNIVIKQDSIKTVGNYEADVKLYKNIKVKINFEVFAE